MGGNGTFAAGKIVAQRWEAVGKVHGVKVLRPILPAGQKRISQKLPEESHASRMYILNNHDGTFRQLRVYDAHHRLQFEIGNHRESNIDPHGTEVLHYHVYTQPGFKHGPAHPLTDAMLRKFGKYMKGTRK